MSIELQIIDILAYLATLTQDPAIHINIAGIAFHASVRLGRNPSRSELSLEIWQNKSCGCTDAIPRSSVLLIMDRLLSWQMIEWECEYILMMHQYFVIHSILPTSEELSNFTLQLDQFAQDAAGFSNSDRVRIGADISAFIHTDPAPPHTTCGLCFSEITTTHYKLPCGHFYHAAAADCLDTTVQTWFEKNVKCPLCNRDMREHGAPTILNNIG